MMLAGTGIGLRFAGPQLYCRKYDTCENPVYTIV